MAEIISHTNVLNTAGATPIPIVCQIVGSFPSFFCCVFDISTLFTTLHLLFIIGGNAPLCIQPSLYLLTVCVTRAGAGGGTPSDWENAEA